MECSPFREALSALLDGEEPGITRDALQRHLDGCPACRRWSDDVVALEAGVLDRASADLAPDLTAAVLARISPLAPVGSVGMRPSGREVGSCRAALSVVAVGQLAVAAADLLRGSDGGMQAHLALELGSWDVALAVGFLFAAWRPSRAWGMLPLVAALVLCTAATAVVGLAAEQASVLRESGHVLELIGLPLLWVLARQSRPRTASLRVA